MTRFLSALFFVGLGMIFGFTLAGGRLGTMIQLPILLIIGSFVAGSMVLSFGVLQPFRTLVDAFRGERSGRISDFQTHVLVCECASRATMFGAAIAFLLGFIRTGQDISGDVSALGAYIAASTTAPIVGVILSLIIFKNLKHRFLLLQTATRAEPITVVGFLKGCLLVVIGFALAATLIGLYMARIAEFLDKILRPH